MTVYSDVRTLHVVEDWGVRTYVVLVCKGSASVVRLGGIVEGRRTLEEVEAALDAQVADFRKRLDRLAPNQQEQFAVQVDETVDPYALLDRLASGSSIGSPTES